jgi:hypothetical protein
MPTSARPWVMSHPSSTRECAPGGPLCLRIATLGLNATASVPAIIEGMGAIAPVRVGNELPYARRNL